MNVRALIVARTREPSTWAGLAMLLGLTLPAEVAQALAGVAGALAVLLPERGAK